MNPNQILVGSVPIALSPKNHDNLGGDRDNIVELEKRREQIVRFQRSVVIQIEKVVPNESRR